ncbi:RNA 2',3'-cyclic phosphodiesterase [Evansella halocellulosilytica]|uniref:RNA 2',3'-cyclic phosphodiesterase n=1 Tax=Evansella halocellulosilytica TaxID=2011013 RepID=UPI000BB6B712|nr:RNA 2',3'-cyclic phosphodiesterase [Evansella halocellulosilytica]
MNQAHYFIGVHTSSEVQKHLSYIQKQTDLLSYYKKLTYEQDFHLTLLFLGSFTEEKRSQLWSMLKQEVMTIPSFSLTLSKIGTFGNEQLPRVYWAGVKENDTLKRLHKLVEQKANTVGFQVESRPFQPHITLAKTLRDKVNQRISTEAPMKQLSWNVDKIHLYKVRRGQKPMYESVTSIPLLSK